MSNKKASIKSTTMTLSDGPKRGKLTIDELKRSKIDELRAIGLKMEPGATLNYTDFSDPGPWKLNADAGFLLWTLRNMVLRYYDYGQITLDYDQDCTIMYPIFSPPNNELSADGIGAGGVVVVPWDTGTETANGSNSTQHIHIGPVPYDVRQYGNLLFGRLSSSGGFWTHN